LKPRKTTQILQVTDALLQIRYYFCGISFSSFKDKSKQDLILILIDFCFIKYAVGKYYLLKAFRIYLYL